MIRLFFIGLLSSFLVSCLSMKERERRAKYIEFKNAFDKSLTTLFPEELPEGSVFGFAAPYEGRIPGRLYLLTKINSEREYFDIKENFQKRATYHKLTTDSCLFVIVNQEGIANSKCDVFYPVSLDAVYNSDIRTIKVTRKIDQDVFILGHKPGNFLESESHFNAHYLPSDWASGYSTGVTMNDKDKTVLYWFVVW